MKESDIHANNIPPYQRVRNYELFSFELQVIVTFSQDRFLWSYELVVCHRDNYA